MVSSMVSVELDEELATTQVPSAAKVKFVLLDQTVSSVPLRLHVLVIEPAPMAKLEFPLEE